MGTLSEGVHLTAYGKYSHLDPTSGNSESIGQGGAAILQFHQLPADSDAQPELMQGSNQEQGFGARPWARSFASLSLDFLMCKVRTMRIAAFSAEG